MITLSAATLAAGTAAHLAFGYASADLSGHAYGSDDAFISFRYAENLIDGHGLVFNPGARVEGYSNLLYVLLCSLLVAISRDGVLYLAVAANALFSLAAALFFYGHLRARVGPGPALLGVALFALSPSLWLWAASGLETSLVVLLQMMLWIAAERLRGGGDRSALAAFCALSALMILTRADGFVFVAISLGWLWLNGGGRALWIASAFSAGVVGVHVGWRYLYYGYPLPNTYYVKVSGPALERIAYGLGWLSDVLIRNGFAAYMALVAIWVVLDCWRSGTLRALRSFEGVATAGLLAYTVWIGGDAFGERFLLILIPLGISAGLRIARLSGRRGASAILAAVVAAAALLPTAFDPRFSYGNEKYDRWIELGRILGERHPGATLAVDAAGKIPFYSGLYAIDMLGLNDRFIAHKPTEFFVVGHNKFDADYVLLRGPDLISGWAKGSDGSLFYGLDRRTYLERGYRLRYLVNATPAPMPHNVLDARGMSPDERAAWIRGGYRYLVLERVPEPRSDLR